MSNINPQTIEGKFAYYTEVALATVEMLLDKKSSTKHEKARAIAIANGMVDVVRETAELRQFVTETMIGPIKYPRLAKLLKEKS